MLHISKTQYRTELETLLKICEVAGPAAARLYAILLDADGCVDIDSIQMPTSSKYTAAKKLELLGVVATTKSERGTKRLCIRQ